MCPISSLAGLPRRRRESYCVIVPYITHGVFADAIQGVADALENRGYCVLLGNSAGSVNQEEQIVRILLGHRPAGVVIQGANHTEATRRLLRNASIPVVEIGTLPKAPIDMAVGYSNFEAARAMTRYLIERGHRRIGFVSATPTENDRAAERLGGYRAALTEAGLEYNRALVLYTTFGIREGRTALHDVARAKRQTGCDFLCIRSMGRGHDRRMRPTPNCRAWRARHRGLQ